MKLYDAAKPINPDNKKSISRIWTYEGKKGQVKNIKVNFLLIQKEKE